MNAQPPLEHDLHAYADRRLDPDQAETIARWLRTHADEAARLHDWQRQNEALHHRFDAVLDEPVPTRLTRAAHGERSIRPRLSMAAAIGWLMLGILFGLGIPQLFPRDETSALSGLALGKSAAPAHFSRQAAIAHAVYAVEQRHPVEVSQDQEAHLVQWLSRRTGVALRVPDLNSLGFALIGGRLLPGDQGPMAQFMYEDVRQRRVTLYLGRDHGPSPATSGPTFGYASEQGTHVFFWADGDVNYALSGNLERTALLDLSQQAYRQLSATP